MLYQIQTKYRDEARPRAGILRGREFLMKDSYSFDLTDEGLAESYQLHRDAYVRIFDRLGLEYVIVAATSGAMGGSASEEFLAVADTGEDTLVRSPGGYAANVEAVTTPAPPAQPVEGLPAAQAHHTPDTPTIEHARRLPEREGRPGPHLHRGRHAEERAGQDPAAGLGRSGRCSGSGVPGDREVDMKRLEAALDPAEVALLDESDFAAHPFLVKGYIGPAALAANGVRFLVDPRIVHRHRLGHRRRQARPPRRRPRLRPRLHPGRHDRGRRGARGRPRARRLRPPGGGARHRDRARVPARPQVRRRDAARRARRRQQADPDHDGLLRRRGVAAGRRRSPSRATTSPA